MRTMGADPVFQEYSRGRVLHFVAVADREHEIVAVATHLTTRLGGSETGQSARAVTVPTDARLKRGVQAFLTALSWFGLADLQFWLTKGGEALLSDFNGRIYGALALPYASGMQPMDTWARLATGREVQAASTRIGVRYQAMEGDLKHVLLQPGLWGKMQVGNVLAHSFPCVHPIFNWSDPLPALTYLARLPLRARRKLAAR